MKLGVSTATFEWLTQKGYEPIFDFLRVKRGDDKFKVLNQYEIPEVKLFYQKMAEWYKKGYIRQDVLGIQNLRQDEGKKDGYALWVHNSLKGQAEIDSKRFGFPIDVVNMGDKFYTDSGTVTTSTAITRTCKNPERAIKVIELLNTNKDLYNTLVYGLDNVHYIKKSDNRIETIGYSGQPTSDAKYGLWKWVVGNTFNAYETQADSENWNDYILNEVNGKAIISPIIGFKYDISKVNSEIVQIRSVIKEFSATLSSGSMGDYESFYNKLISKLKMAGIDRVSEEFQRQLDEYVKGKK